MRITLVIILMLTVAPQSVRATTQENPAWQFPAGAALVLSAGFTVYNVSRAVQSGDGRISGALGIGAGAFGVSMASVVRNDEDTGQQDVLVGLLAGFGVASILSGLISLASPSSDASSSSVHLVPMPGGTDMGLMIRFRY